jgi:serine/threonine protein phosphatase PrpC
MNISGVPTIRAYKALIIVSPMLFGDDKKDQDRARWSEPGQIACICDGVSSSPESAVAAELVTSFIPAVFTGDFHDRLTMLCDLLMALREEFQANNTIIFPDNVPKAMQDMLYRIVQRKKATSFQTTIVAAKFVSEENKVVANVFKCGDSEFFAFSPQGQLLTSSLAFPSSRQNDKDAPSTESGTSLMPKKISFGPGDEILVRIEGQLSEYWGIAKQAGIKAEHIQNWLVCAPLDSCRAGNNSHLENLLDLHTLSLKPSDRLLVPKYLYGTQLTSQDGQYRVLRYSSTIRPVFATGSFASIDSFNHRGSATMVLPDHFYCGSYDSFQDTFPPQTSFILCSDGFYGGFSDWQQLWTWLQVNASGLNRDSDRQAILEQLHTYLHNRGGDDDISFVWIQPNISNPAESSPKGADNLCQQKL